MAEPCYARGRYIFGTKNKLQGKRYCFETFKPLYFGDGLKTKTCSSVFQPPPGHKELLPYNVCSRLNLSLSRKRQRFNWPSFWIESWNSKLPRLLGSKDIMLPSGEGHSAKTKSADAKTSAAKISILHPPLENCGKSITSQLMSIKHFADMFDLFVNIQLGMCICTIVHIWIQRSFALN